VWLADTPARRLLAPSGRSSVRRTRCRSCWWSAGRVNDKVQGELSKSFRELRATLNTNNNALRKESYALRKESYALRKDVSSEIGKVSSSLKQWVETREVRYDEHRAVETGASHADFFGFRTVHRPRCC
jgi:hypothetical protein